MKPVTDEHLAKNSPANHEPGLSSVNNLDFIAASQTEAPLDSRQLGGIIVDINAGNRMPLRTVREFLGTPIDAVTNFESSKIDKLVPTVLGVGYIALFGVVKTYQENLPSFGTLPQLAHNVLQAVHNISTNSADTPAIRDHLPFILGETAAGWLGLRTALPKLRNFSKNKAANAAINAQDTLSKRVESGTMPYQLPEGATVALVGNGDPLASELSRLHPDSVLQIAHSKVDGLWTHLPKDASLKATFEAFDKANIENAGEIMILPTVEQHQFLPGADNHDMSVDGIVAQINSIDEYCKAHGIPPKKVIVVGSKQQTESYVATAQDGTITEQETETLEQRLEELITMRGGKIEILDPTEIIMDKIVQLAEGRNIIFKATEESTKLYGNRFVEALNRQEYTVEDEGEPVTVRYNITDIPTRNFASSNDIAIILDPSQKSALLSKGVSEDRIIVVSNEILKAMSQNS